MGQRDRDIYTLLKLGRDKSNKELASRGLSVSTVRNIRKSPKAGGTLYPRYSTMKKMADACGVKLGFIDPVTGRDIKETMES